MDMEQIDTVRADTLEPGDNIQWWDDEGAYLGVLAIKDIIDDGEWITLVSEDDDEMPVTADYPAALYGYTVEEV